MIQIFFFISMIALAALLLNLLWYLEDSRREESEFEQNHGGASHRKHSRSRAAASRTSSAILYRGHTSPNSGRTFAVESLKPTDFHTVRFFEIGPTEEVPSFRSLTQNQSKSA